MSAIPRIAADAAATLSHREAPQAPQAPQVPLWRTIFAGFCATLVGLGLARFGYTPLLPAIIDAHWFSASAATYLGAANLVGYLAGALLGGPMSARWPVRSVLRAMMLVTAASLLACAWPVDFAWFFTWRIVSGIAGGALMVLAAPVVLAHVPAHQRGVASGLIFAGVGLGIAASGTLVPLLLRQGLTATWIGLAVLALLLTVVSWQGWPTAAPAQAAAAAHATHAKAARPARSALASGALIALMASYALNAVGLVPHMIFLVDYVARGLGQGLAAGAQYWVLFGIGAIVGPVLCGHLADRAGFGPALRIAFAVQAVALALPALGLVAHGGLIVSSVIVGAFTPGIVPLVLGRVQELLAHHPSLQKAAWSRATTAFAVLQASAAYGMSWLLGYSGGHYAWLFALGGSALVLGLLTDLVAGKLHSSR
ncbi:Predicted arabinose efflux permease, MFS family [Variovorax sp. OK605]|uniref:YbfB/YjiJ family MFS transporter n=1 Tax=Variovorax sp. OK605 TaxID=1855317 RepID=UPI0008E609CB|nr:YbfB/YjiJ family MFS transporter [Variovorax sp. OK605]SFO94417.1 Predicted arabinose efflux permease, MFS family [Variovorax sp. OK605]